MTRHAQKLARFKAGYEAQRQKMAGVQDKLFTSETVMELAAVYQIAPFAKRYPLAPSDGRCPHCRADVGGKSAAPVVAMYADRTVYDCRKCAGRFVGVKC